MNLSREGIEEMLHVILNIQFSNNFIGQLIFQKLGTTFSIPEAVILLLLFINHVVPSIFFARW